MFKLCGSLSLQACPIHVAAPQLQLVVCGWRWPIKSERVLVQGLDYAGARTHHSTIVRSENRRDLACHSHYIPSHPIICTPLCHVIPHCIHSSLYHCSPSLPTKRKTLTSTEWSDLEWVKLVSTAIKEWIMANLRYAKYILGWISRFIWLLFIL